MAKPTKRPPARQSQRHDDETLLSASQRRIEAVAEAARERIAEECAAALEAERRARTMLRAPTGTHSFGEILHAIAAVPDDS